MSNPLLTDERRTERVPLYPPGFRAWVAEQLQAVDDMETAAQSDKRKRAKATKMAEDLDAQLEHPETLPGVRVFVVGSVSSTVEKRLLDEHPPRKGNQGDAGVGYDREGFRVALVRACLLEPEVTAEQFDEWAAAAPTGEFEKVWKAVERVQYGVDELPKFSAVSALRLRRATASQQQPDTE